MPGEGRSGLLLRGGAAEGFSGDDHPRSAWAESARPPSWAWRSGPSRGDPASSAAEVRRNWEQGEGRPAALTGRRGRGGGGRFGRRRGWPACWDRPRGAFPGGRRGASFGCSGTGGRKGAELVAAWGGSWSRAATVSRPDGEGLAELVHREAACTFRAVQAGDRSGSRGPGGQWDVADGDSARRRPAEELLLRGTSAPGVPGGACGSRGAAEGCRAFWISCPHCVASSATGPLTSRRFRPRHVDMTADYIFPHPCSPPPSRSDVPGPGDLFAAHAEASPRRGNPDPARRYVQNLQNRTRRIISGGEDGETEGLGRKDEEAEEGVRGAAGRGRIRPGKQRSGRPGSSCCLQPSADFPP